MKNNLTQIILIVLVVLLFIWAICCLENIEHKISVFGIVAIIATASVSVHTVSLNNRKAKEKEYELMVLKEKKEVFKHFYNSFFERLKNKVNKGEDSFNEKTLDEMMLFKKGLMNWGSEEVINEFLSYEKTIFEKQNTLVGINDFLKELRKEMGFSDSKELDLMDMILGDELKKQLKELEEKSNIK